MAPRTSGFDRQSSIFPFNCLVKVIVQPPDACGFYLLWVSLTFEVTRIERAIRQALGSRPATSDIITKVSCPLSLYKTRVWESARLPIPWFFKLFPHFLPSIFPSLYFSSSFSCFFLHFQYYFLVHDIYNIYLVFPANISSSFFFPILVEFLRFVIFPFSRRFLFYFRFCFNSVQSPSLLSEDDTMIMDDGFFL